MKKLIFCYLLFFLTSCQTTELPVPSVQLPKPTYGIVNMQLAVEAGTKLLKEAMDTVSQGFLNIILDAPELYRVVKDVSKIDYDLLAKEFHDLDMQEKAKLAEIFVLQLGEAFLK